MQFLLFAQQRVPQQAITEADLTAIYGMAVCFGVGGFIFGLLMLVSFWKIFTKAGKPGWAILIPIYNLIVYLDIAGKPAWWFLLFLIPLVNIVFAIMALAGFARAFGKGAGFVVGLIFLPMIFYPILGFGSARYRRISESDY